MDESSASDHSETIIRERKEKVLNFIKKDTNFISYVLLAIITFLAIRIRIANLPGLRDITTGDWTLGPDLDPFLFLRWAKYILEHGALMVVDTMRYAPLGYDTAYELNLHVYLITWFHKIAVFFGSGSITQSAVLYPAVMFALAVIAFFFMTRKFFAENMGKNKANIIALVASLFLSVIPALLPRTIAGIPEKEASGILFLFLAFYFFMCGWKARGQISRYTYGLLAGISTDLMGLVWGGYLYIILTIGPAVLIAFLLGKMDKGKKYLYAVWLLTAFILLFLGTNRYSLSELLTSTTNLPSVLALLVIIVDSILFDTRIKNYLSHEKIAKIPRPIFSLLTTIVLVLVVSAIVFGPSLIGEKVLTLKKFLVTTSTDRLSVTVAENKQPYFVEWADSFGPKIAGVKIIFWSFFFGAIGLFYRAIKSLNSRERMLSTLAFTLFLTSIIFSRYSGNSTFNGTNGLSLLFYALGPIVLLATLGYYYRLHYKSGEQERLKNIEFSSIFVLCFFLISLISARGGIRLVMMLVPAASILAAYLSVEIASLALNTEKSTKRTISIICAGIIIVAFIFSGYQFYKTSVATAAGYIPSPYNQQWQKAMAWVRESTPPNAVFGHWWDYGYWVQTLGERATVLDGGNAKSYWNHLMGRYALTGTSNKEALEFLYAHNTTHFLIDSTDIGKYSAFSSIGSDKNYDRVSFFATFNQDLSQIQERKNSTVFLYSGGVLLDADIIYEDNGTRIFLPEGTAALGALLIEKSSTTGEMISQPVGIFVNQDRQYNLPLRYAFDGELKDFGSGIESGVFFIPRLINGANGLQIQDDGSLLYLSSRAVNSQFARLYFYNEVNPNFELVHSEDDFFVAEIKKQVPSFNSSIISYDALRGPIKIWEIHYPSDIEFKKEYLSEEWPPELLRV